MIDNHGYYCIDPAGQAYFCIGDTRIKITEHFPQTGKTVADLIGDMILSAARQDG